jgi:hypothetical protein
MSVVKISIVAEISKYYRFELYENVTLGNSAGLNDKKTNEFAETVKIRDVNALV